MDSSEELTIMGRFVETAAAFVEQHPELATAEMRAAYNLSVKRASPEDPTPRGPVATATSRSNSFTIVGCTP